MAYDFDGANDAIHWGASTIPGIDSAGLSFSFWVNIGSAPGTGLHEAIVATAQDATTAATNTRRCTIVEDTGAFYLALFAPSSGTNGIWRGGTALSTGTWYQVVITYDRTLTTNDPIIYLNGVAETVTELSTPTATIRTGEDSVRCGEAIGGSLDFDGTLAEAAIWSRILSAAEALSLGKGYTPDWLPLNLGFYADLRDTAARERVTGLAATLTGNAVRVAHPPLVIPFPATRAAFKIAAAGGATTTEYYYRRRRAA